MKLTIIGGGSLGHVCAAVASTHSNCEVSLLSGHPEQWGLQVVAIDPGGKQFSGLLKRVSAEPEVLIPDADIVLLCVPGYLIEQTLNRIAPFLGKNTCVGSIVSSTGFFFQAHRLLPDTVPLFGYQRVPFIARVTEYGHTASLLGYKKEVAIAVEHCSDSEILRSQLEYLFITPTKLLNSFYEAALTNSNPILHTGRLYSMWHEWNGEPFDHQILFYAEWDVPSAQMLIDMDAEFMALLEKLPVRQGIIPSLLDYYESNNAESLTVKLRSIPAFKTITAPMLQTPNGWIPDFSSRYFTEDFPFGLRYIKELSEANNLKTPTLEKVLRWGLDVTK